MQKLNINTSIEVVPKCYAYTTPGISYHDGWTKIGFTERDAEVRIKEQTHTANIRYKKEWVKNATFEGGNDTFTDKEFHGYLNKLGVKREKGTEWFKISPEKAKYEFNEFRENRGLTIENKDPIPYKLRFEQEEAVNKTIEYFKTHKDGEFLWNAKPRFGKTISSYDLCMKMGFQNILVVTNRPAIVNSWYADYEKFIGLNSGYYFVSHVQGVKDNPNVLTRSEYIEKMINDENIKGCIEFVSLQDLKGSKYFGGDPNNDKLKELSSSLGKDGKPIGITWDILIIDEAHEGVDTYKTDLAFDHIKRLNTLHLSGTPFKAIASDKFSEDAIYNWTYSDEQKAKENWDYSREEENPYLPLPKLNLYTYQMSEIVREEINEGIILDGEAKEYAFDLNEFFSTNTKGDFVYDSDVDKFLDSLTHLYKFPFSTEDLRDELKHTFWILDRVDSAKALANKLKVNPIFRDYEIILAAGDGKLSDEDIYEESYTKVVEAIKKYDKTITLSVVQLTTGITIPEWTAVLILSNMKSPALYMQAAFRAQNPCLFKKNNKNFRKKNAYVFDFDPTRSLEIFEEFANDLSKDTAKRAGDFETRKENIRELLNFFPIYGEDENGYMVELDAKKVMTIPRKIHAVEVVKRGFMSNFLFSNISNIFQAPSIVKNILEKVTPVEEGKKFENIDLDEDTRDDLSLDENNEVSIDKDKIIGKANDIFGDKIYKEIDNKVNETVEEYQNNNKKLNSLDRLKKDFSKPLVENLIEVSKNTYKSDLSSSSRKKLENTLKNFTDNIVNKKYGDYEIDKNLLISEKNEKINEAKTSKEVSKIEKDYDKKIEEKVKELTKDIKEAFESDEVYKRSAEYIVETVETDKKEKEKKSIEDNVREHLRGFARTIPSFLMAYGDYNTTLENFDKIVPDDVFIEVTSISIDEFRFLRDGGDYTDEEENVSKHYEGKLFDPVVFNDSIKEFLNKKEELSNYFDSKTKGDIFDYIPPQKTNQKYTPKKVVVEMVDLLEEENPGCFDNKDKTFIDLYMKSGLYIAEIVKRLYQSEKMKEIFPNDIDRLNHIFKNQVYGLAPTEIIYRISLNFVLGFSDKIKIQSHNLRKLDSLAHIKKGDLEEKLEEIFE